VIMAKDEIIIELGKAGGGDIEFPPAMSIYRGRFSQAEMKPCNQSRAGVARRLPTIPGLCVALDITNRTGRIFDPLGMPDKKDVLVELKNLLSQTSGAVVNKGDPTPVKEQTWQRMSDSDIASWHHWMRRLVEDDRHAILRQGRFIDQDKLPGRVRLDFVSDPRTGPVYQDQFDRLEQGTYIFPGQPGYAEQEAAAVAK
jgi:hypothetical protein